MAGAKRPDVQPQSGAEASVFVALLRGINVAGHQPVKMDALRAAFEAMGFGRVATYLQSGNVVFAAPEAAPTADLAALAAAIERRLRDDLGIAVSVVVKSSGEMERIVENNPFVSEAGIDPTKLHVTFPFEPPAQPALRKLAALDAGGDRFRYAADVLYLHCPNGYGRSRLGNPALERVLAVRATTRNWRTVGELRRLATE